MKIARVRSDKLLQFSELASGEAFQYLGIHMKIEPYQIASLLQEVKITAVNLENGELWECKNTTVIERIDATITWQSKK